MTSADAMTLGIQQQQAGNLGQAEMLYCQVLAAEPQHANARFRFAVVCQMQGRLAEAVEHYRYLLHLQPGSAQAHNNLGLALAALGRHGEALPHCREAIRLQPDCAELFNNLGTVHSALNALDLAGDAFRHALELKPRYPAAWNNLGKVHIAQNRLDDAVHSFQQALALQPNDAVVLTNLGSALMHQGKPLEAVNCYRQALRVRPDYAEARHNIARVHEAMQQLEETAAREDDRLQRAPKDATAYAKLGDVYNYGLGKYADAVRCYREVLALCPEDERVSFLVEVLSGGSKLPRVPAVRISSMYDEEAADFEQRVARRGDCSPQLLKAALTPPATPNTDVLDLGCGTGLCGVQFRPWASTLTGVDLSAKMLEQARQRGIYDELIHSDVLTPLQAAHARFDLVVASDVLLFLGELAPLFHAAAQALRPGGRFAFTLDTLDGPGDYRMTPWAHFAHAPAYLERVLAEAHLRKLSLQHVRFPRDGGHEAQGVVVVASAR
jgi:predicted TPR repeat methyltransferase